MIMDDYKPEGVCPVCGELYTNWHPLNLYTERRMDNNGKVFTVKRRICIYTCAKCGHKWEERWDM